MKKMMAIMVVVAAVLTGCGDYSVNKGNDNSVDNSVDNGGNTTTYAGDGLNMPTDENGTSTNGGLDVPQIDAYSTGKVVLDCKDPSNIRGMSVYKCLKPNTKTYAFTDKGTETDVDRYKIDDRFVLEFSIDGVSNGQEIVVRGVVDTTGTEDQTAMVVFGTATCKVGE